MNAKIRVLFAIPALDRGGPDRVVFERLSTLDRSRFAPSLMGSQGDGHYHSRLPPDVPVHVLGSSARYPVVRAIRHVRASRPDIVFATLRMITTLGVAAPALPSQTRLVVRPASPVTADFAALVQQSLVKHRVARALVLASLRRADAVVCQSSSMQSDLATLVGGATSLHVVGNPIDVQRVRVSASSSVPLRGDPALVSVGRLVPLKGYDLLLRALVPLRRAYPGLHLTILGEGPERAALERLARDLAVADAVTFAGFVDEPLPYVRAANLFVLPSRYDAFSNAALEALACGTPVVLTDCPGANRELVVPGLNGQLASAPEVEPLVHATQLAISQLARFDRTEITRDCDRRFGASKIVAAYERVFSLVAEGTL